MELKNFYTQDTQGNILPGAQVYVYDRGTLNLVSGVKDATGGDKTNPFPSDDDGLATFAVPNGLYDVRVVSSERDTKLPMQFFDTAEGMAAVSELVDEAEAAQNAAQSSATAAAASAEAAAGVAAAQVDNFKVELGNPSDPTKGIHYVGYKGRRADQRLAETRSLRDFYPTEDTTDAQAELAAHAEAGVDGAVSYPAGSYTGLEPWFNMYGNAIYNKALNRRVQVGRNAAPASDPNPVDWLQKFTVADRVAIPTAFDQTRYTGVKKNGGSAFVVANTDYGLYSSGSGDMIAHHSRVKIQAAGEGVRAYASWIYIEVDSDDVRAAHGAEINGCNRKVDFGHGGKLQLVRICMADSSDTVNRFPAALTIGKTTHGGDNGFWTGIVVEADAIIKTPNQLDNGEIAWFLGPAAGGSIGGIRYDTGVFKYALRTDTASFTNNNVLLLGTSQRIRWGDPATGVSITGGSASLALTGGILNISNPVSGVALQVAGVKVLGPRSTGWTADAGVAKRTANTTFSQTAPAAYNQASMQAICDALRDATQTIKAMKDDNITHGLYGN